MATVQEPTRAAGRHESFVAAQIDRATRRIRGHDVGIATLGLVAGGLAYTLGMILLDRWLVLPALVRQAAFGLAFAVAIAYAAVILSRPFRRTVNPYYAARQVERTIPGAKNSVVNWLDLHDRNLPPAIRQALSHKAAIDLDHADIDAAVRDNRMIWLGWIAGGLGLAALVMLLVLRPGPFFSLLGRNLAPFAFTTTDIARQTQLEIMQPSGGDVTVSVHRSVEFHVGVGGRVPSPDAADAIRLQWKYNPSDPVWEEQRFERTPQDPREFSLRVPAVKVQNGFVYRVAGGDDLTAEHRVSVRSTPLIESFEVTYHYRPYLRFEDQSSTKPNLEALRGTEVTLIANTNRTVRAGGLHFVAGQSLNRDPAAEGGKAPETLSVPGVLLADKPNALRFRFTLEKDGHYTITFAATDGEENDRDNLIPYPVKVLSDQPPQIDITRPSADPLPLNAALEVEGKASDDFGLVKMRLCLQAKDDAKAVKVQPLASKPHRPEKSFQFPDGTFPRALDYKDFLKLDELKTPLGGRVEPKAGMVIEYWLEAEDNCDYPKANVGRSQVKSVTLAPPQEQTPQEKKDQEQQMRDAKTAHDQQQDQAQQQEAAGKQPQKPTGEPNQDANQQNQQQNPGQADQQQPQQPKDPLDKKAEEIKKKIEERNQGQGGNQQNGQPEQNAEPNRGQGKDAQPNAGQGANDPQKSPPAEGKGDPNAGQPPQPGAEKNGAGKDEGQKDQPPQPGAAKPQPDQGGANQQPQPNQAQGDQNQGAAKPQPQGGSENAGQSKPQPQQGSEPGAAKEQQTAPKPQPNPQQNADANKADGAKDNAAPPKPQPNQQGADANKAPGPKDKSAPKPPPNPQSADANKTGANEKANPLGGSNDKSGSEGKAGQAKEGQQKSGNKSDAGNKTTGGSGATKNEQPKQAPEKGKGHDAQKASSNAQQDADKNKSGGTGSGQSSPGQPGAGQEQPMDAQNPAGDSKPEPGAAKGPDSNDHGVAKDNPQTGSGNSTGQKQPGAAKPDTQGQPQQKPGNNQSSDGKTGTGQQEKSGAGEKGNSQSAADARQATEEIAKLAKDLTSGDPQKRDAARQKLEQLRDAARDARTRQEAQEALKQGQDGDASKGQKPGDPGAGKQPGAGEPTPKAGDPNGPPQPGPKGTGGAPMATGEQKSASPDTRPGPSQKASSKTGDGEGTPSPGGGGRDPSKPDPNQKEAGHSGTGVHTATRRSPGDSSPAGPAEAGEGSAPNAAHAAKSGELLLEDFKKVDKKLLDDLKMTQEEWDAFQKAYAERLKQKSVPAAGDQKRGAAAGPSAANKGARQVQSGSDKQNSLERGSIIQPPAEYRDGYRGFTQDLSKSQPPPKKDQK
jgi:hypothetical protein